MNEHPALTFVSLSRSQTQFFEQLSDEEFWRYATEAALFVPSVQYQSDEYLVCYTGARRCIFPLATLGELVSPPQQLTFLPTLPAWTLGLTTWRGELIAVIDLDAYLWNGSKPTESIFDMGDVQVQSERLLVVQTKDVTLGLVATVFNKTMRFDEQHMLPFDLTPDWCSLLRSGVVKGIIDDTLVLDIPFICNDIVRNLKEPIPS